MSKEKGAYTKYNANYKRYTIKLHLRNDSDLIEMLESFDVQPYVLMKQLLKQYAETLKEGAEHA